MSMDKLIEMRLEGKSCLNCFYSNNYEEIGFYFCHDETDEIRQLPKEKVCVGWSSR
jgi:hypothetical protein